MDERQIVGDSGRQTQRSDQKRPQSLYGEAVISRHISVVWCVRACVAFQVKGRYHSSLHALCGWMD